jgi:septal ring factor EnvC (AmiA/AmiB activator)
MKRVLIAMVVVALAAPVLAADEPAFVARAKAEIVKFLALTADQVTTWEGLIAAHQQAVQPVRDQLTALADQIKGLLEGSKLDPNAIGALTIQAAALRAQIEAADQAYVKGFEQMLGADQLKRLAFVRLADTVAPLFPAFRIAGLLPPLKLPGQQQ